MSSKRDESLAEVKSLLKGLTDEQCKLAACAVKIYMEHRELSPEECVERANKKFLDGQNREQGPGQ